MIRVNLIGERKVAKKKIAFPIAQQITVVSAAIMVATGLVVGWRYWSLNRAAARLTTEITKAQNETSKLKAVIAQVQQFEDQKNQLQQRIELIEQLRKDQTGPVHLLDEVSRALPPMLWLTDLKESASGEVLIDGRANALTSITDFVTNLEQSGYFQKSIEIVSTSSDTTATASKVAATSTGEMIKFQVKAVFKTPGGSKTVPGTASTQKGN